MLRLFLVFIFVGLTATLTSQLNEDFNSGSLSNWTGDLTLFTINEDSQLQLNAIEAGTATIFTPVSYSDSIQWSIDLDLRFAPSGSNALLLWLAVDDITSATPTGYKIELGETGSNDAINLLWVDQGVETLIGQGEMGQVASAFELQLIITKASDDLWTLATRNAGDDTVEEAFSVNFSDSYFPREGQFGISCSYTSTRITSFYFDNIVIGDLLPDSEAPILTSTTVVSPTKIVVEYNEPLDEATVINSNFTLSDGIMITEARLTGARTVCLELASPLSSATETTLNISGISDLAQNTIGTTTVALVITEQPVPGDLVINELLYDPNPGNSSDFVELINISNKNLTLDQVYLGRANSTASDVQLTQGLTLAPGEIIAFANDRREIIDEYNPIAQANIVELNITNYVNSEGNVWLKSEIEGDLVTLDSLDYDDNFHASLLTTANKEGVSIERISTTAETNDRDNWFSASSTNNFATPGYANSQAGGGAVVEGNIALEYKVFTPNADGFRDFARLNFEFDKAGFVGNVSIYDDHGRLQTTIAQNKLLGTSGSIIWEGALEDGSIAPVGMYIIYYDLFHADGEVISGKEVCVLSSAIN